MKVITRRDIELSGVKRIRDLLGRASFNNFGIARPLRTLILINGRRVSDSGVDTDTIPIAAVERIEIFGDSTSALHGGGAIGGTINIVLKKDYEGLDIQLNAGRPRGEGADSEHLSVLWGTSVGEGNLTVGADIFRRDEVRDIDRDYSRARYQAGGSFADTEGVSSLGNTVFLEKDDGGRISAPLGDCDESVYTGSTHGSLRADFSAPSAGLPMGISRGIWIAGRMTTRVMNFNYPLGDAADIYIEGRANQGRTKEPVGARTERFLASRRTRR